MITSSSPIPLVPEVRDIPLGEEEEEKEDEGEWTTSSETGESDGNNVFGNFVKCFPSVAEEFKEVVNRYGEGWRQKLNVFEKRLIRRKLSGQDMWGANMAANKNVT